MYNIVYSMEFTNPLNGLKQICNPNIYNKSNISKPDLNKLLLHLQDKNKLKYSKKLSLRLLRTLSYKECCEILMTSNLKFTTNKNNKNYSNISCLDMSLNDLKIMAKNNFIQISNNKNLLCNELINLNYKFKDNNEILQNANINKMRISLISTNTMLDNQLPMDILIKQNGINIYTHTKKYIYIPKTFIDNINIDIVNSIITFNLNNNEEYYLQYKNIDTSKNIIKLYLKYSYDYTKLLIYLNSIYADINLQLPTKHNIIIWSKNNCKNYDNCSESLNKNLLLQNKVCVKNKFTDDYININNLIQLNDKKCYDINDIKNLIKFEDVEDINLQLSDLEKQYITTI